MSPSRDLHCLLALGGLEVLAEHVLAGLQPPHTAQPRNVQQHAAADETVLDERRSPQPRRPSAVTESGRDAVVEATLVGDVAERVDVRVPVAVVVDSDEVLRKAHRAQADVGVVALGHPEFGRVRAVGRRPGVQRQAEAHDDTAAHQAARRPRRDRA